MPRKIRNINTTVTDTFVLPDGREGTIESGNAYENLWNMSGFSGGGYVFCVEGVATAQAAWRAQIIYHAKLAGAVQTSGPEWAEDLALDPRGSLVVAS